MRQLFHLLDLREPFSLNSTCPQILDILLGKIGGEGDQGPFLLMAPHLLFRQYYFQTVEKVGIKSRYYQIISRYSQLGDKTELLSCGAEVRAGKNTNFSSLCWRINCNTNPKMTGETPEVRSD